MTEIALGPVLQWITFVIFGLISVGGALGMATTMSMFRSGILLMASFMGVAGLFILLLADLLGLLQIMMYIGGMLVMILFMVLFAHDPGGDMMAGMKMSPIEQFFSLGLLPRKQGEHDEDAQHAGEPGEQGMDAQGSGAGQMDTEGMEMGDMSMTTPIKRAAAVIGVATAILLLAMLLLRPSWPISGATPDPHSAEQVGSLLMGKYMIAFEGAGLLILIGIFGAVLISRSRRSPDKSGRGLYVTADAPPPPVQDTGLEPLWGLEGEMAVEGLAETFRDEET